MEVKPFDGAFDAVEDFGVLTTRGGRKTGAFGVHGQGSSLTRLKIGSIGVSGQMGSAASLDLFHVGVTVGFLGT